MLLLKIAAQEWNSASRDKRELSVCRELGAEVTVVAKGEPKDWFREDQEAGFNVLRFSTRPLGARFPNALNRFVALFTWAYAARKLAPNIISGHDIPGLTIGWISTWFMPKAKKPKLVYDSHEFEIGRSADRSRLAVWLITHLERHLIKRCAFSIMVNDDIADEVQKIHQLKERPVVIRNTPEYWKVDQDEAWILRKKICEVLCQPEDMFIMMYHGMVEPIRNIEALLQAIARNEKTIGVVLGDASSTTYYEKLKAMVIDANIGNRVYFHEAVTADKLWKYIAASDLGVILHRTTTKNCEYSLPNKLFENIQSVTPILSTNTRTITSLIQQYGVGLVCDIDDTAQFDRCIKRFMEDKAFYNNCEKNLYQAKDELCWEKERAALKKAYESVIHG